MSRYAITVFFVAFAFFLLLTLTGSGNASTCELIKLPMCYNMPWNKTRMPNHLHHSTQENAKLAIEQFHGLVSTDCSAELIFFLCSMYAPICAYGFQEESVKVPPCKSLCLRVKRGCEPIMLRYNVTWPRYLSCDGLPEYDRGVCISPEAIVDEMPVDPNAVTSSPSLIQRPQAMPQVCKDCIGPPRANVRVFLEKQYEYAIRANVTGFEYPQSHRGITWTVVNVNDVLHFQDMFIPKDEVILWTDDVCVCPDVKPGKEYLVMCFQDLKNGHLVLKDDCIVEEWNSEWPNLVKKWYRRLRKSQRLELTNKGQGTKRKNRRKRGKKRDSTERPTPQSNAKRRITQ